MTIVCPACDARFRDPPADVPLDRPLQCGKCEYEWVRGAETEGLAAFYNVTMDELIENRDDTIETQQDVESALPQEPDSQPNANMVVATKQAEHNAVSTKVIDPLFVDREVPTPPARRTLLPMAVATMACLGIVTGAVATRDVIMNHFPASKTAFQLAGFQTEPTGLEIANVETITAEKDGIRQLIVRGDIQNSTSGSVRVPPIKLTMKGDGQTDLYRWTVSASKGTLNSGESGRFTAIAHDYPGDAKDIAVEFAALPVDKKEQKN